MFCGVFVVQLVEQSVRMPLEVSSTTCLSLRAQLCVSKTEGDVLSCRQDASLCLSDLVCVLYEA